MSIGEIAGICIVLSSIVAVVWTISNRPTYKYCDERYQKIEIHIIEYKILLEKIEDLGKKFDKMQRAIDELKNGK